MAKGELSTFFYSLVMSKSLLTIGVGSGALIKKTSNVCRNSSIDVRKVGWSTLCHTKDTFLETLVELTSMICAKALIAEILDSHWHNTVQRGCCSFFLEAGAGSFVIWGQAKVLL